MQQFSEQFFSLVMNKVNDTSLLDLLASYGETH